MKLASSEKNTWLKNKTSVRIFLRIQLQKLTRFSESLPCKSWCNDIRYRWNLCRCKILNTDRWLIPVFFPFACCSHVDLVQQKLRKQLHYFHWQLVDIWLVFVSLYGYEPHANLGRFINIYGIPLAPLKYQNILENRSFSRSDVLTLEGNA